MFGEYLCCFLLSSLVVILSLFLVMIIMSVTEINYLDVGHLLFFAERLFSVFTRSYALLLREDGDAEKLIVSELF